MLALVHRFDVNVETPDSMVVWCVFPLCRYWPERVSSPLEAGRYQLFLENLQQQEYFHIKIIRIVEKEVRETHTH